ncbi:YcnI family protein [Pseudoruegeria sp. SHC-113]|uniref:YcnI family copper-binding membrane protein n=1 Tax=Pseudoruegeria sp. SHC-113 TaxID=2855439 RepID=UPI0021BB9D73|nr:DUF1775 domain-containing protein [Pseudoruegeria sp. SHC-113]MCT8159039.1 DUF1775 domain-containing protein [Pseudoruegeria sp. SHC-113]
MNPIRFALIAAAAASLATGAFAHATLEQQEAASGSYYKAVMRIGHGCDGAATQTVRISIPEGVISVKPMPKAGWSLETVSGPYANTYDSHGRTITEGVKEIVWTGTLEDAHYDEFVFRAKLDGSLAPDTTLYFATVQECTTGENAWVEIPAEGQSRHDLKSPAPGLLITAPAAHTH